MSAYFQTTLIQSLNVGQNLEIRAQAEEDASWFSLSLISTVPDNNSSQIDIVFHMLVSLNANTIAFKQCMNNKWRDIKSLEYETNTFLEPFQICLIVDEQNFHIGLNGEPCAFVKHIQTLEHLNVLKINGHLKDIKQIDHRQHYPYTWPPIQLTENYIDFSNEQPIPFQAGQAIVVKMKLSGNEKGRLIIQFRNVWNVSREELHISIRFDTKKIVRNSKLPKANDDALEFGFEECLEEFPFDVFSKPFKLAIAFSKTAFRVAKDGVFLCDYAFRTVDVCNDLMGLKMFGVNGIKIRVFSIDHQFLNDVQSLDFVKYSKIKYN